MVEIVLITIAAVCSVLVIVLLIKDGGRDD